MLLHSFLAPHWFRDDRHWRSRELPLADATGGNKETMWPSVDDPDFVLGLFFPLRHSRSYSCTLEGSSVTSGFTFRNASRSSSCDTSEAFSWPCFLKKVTQIFLVGGGSKNKIDGTCPSRFASIWEKASSNLFTSPSFAEIYRKIFWHGWVRKSSHETTKMCFVTVRIRINFVYRLVNPVHFGFCCWILLYDNHWEDSWDLGK